MASDPLEAACFEPTKLCHLLKERFPSLRIDTLQRVADVICALIEKQTTNQKKLANGLPGTSTAEAKRKRLARCLQDEQLDACWLPFLISLLPKGKQTLTMDRTNWNYGETPLNLLVRGHQIPGARRNVIQEASLDESDTTCLIVLPNRLGTRLPPFFGALQEASGSPGRAGRG